MTVRSIIALSAVLCATGLVSRVVKAEPSFRPPAVPLVTCDPYFSIWSFADNATDRETTHWTGKSHRLTSLVRIDGQTFRLVGNSPEGVAAAKQTDVSVRPTQTVYTFEQSGVRVTLTFTTPLLPDDLNVLARPVSYVTWSTQSTDGQQHDVSVYFDAHAELAVDQPGQNVIAKRHKSDGQTVLEVGSKDQPVLQKKGDDRRIDWGYLYVAMNGGEASIAKPADARGAFQAGNALPGDASSDPVAASDAPALAVVFPAAKVGAEANTVHVTLAYDDLYSIQYFREKLKPYWKKDGATIDDLLTTSAKEYDGLMKRCAAFDAEVQADLTKLGGESYARIGSLAYRQALAAQKLCADANGQPLSFSKENFSNGCIATVDVMYPASPQMMVFSPSLLKATLVPILDYSASPRWKFDSAPHDIGQYPHATGQVYGGETSSPMPVEESGNMLIMLAALAKVEGNADFSAKYWPTLTKWYEFLKREGLDPANQLCTDDFAGHIARNANLSVKAIMGMASYAMLADMLGKADEAKAAHAAAQDYAKKWMELGADGDHYKLVFGDAGNGTWSQKYNLVWDRLLGFNVFPPEVAQKELAFYKTKFNTYGLPLDSRKGYTKADWEVWTATMAENQADFQQYTDAIAKFASETPTRVPFCDWYHTDSGKQSGFQARSVVGGVFIGVLRDPEMWKKYASRDKSKPSDWAELPWQMPPLKPILAAANTQPGTWKYTIDAPAAEWMQPNFDDKAWKAGRSGFGTRGTPNAIVHTVWNTEQIYLRREFTIPAGQLNDPQLLVHHDEDVEVYINGVQVLKQDGFVSDYTTYPLTGAARSAQAGQERDRREVPPDHERPIHRRRRGGCAPAAEEEVMRPAVAEPRPERVAETPAAPTPVLPERRAAPTRFSPVHRSLPAGANALAKGRGIDASRRVNDNRAGMQPEPLDRTINDIGSRTRELLVGRTHCSPLTPFGIQLAGTSEARYGFRFQRPSPAFVQILACVGGSGEVFVDGQWRICQAGEVYLTPQRQWHAYRAIKNSTWKLAWVMYDEQSVNLDGPPLVATIDSQTLEATILGLYREMHSAAENAALASWAHLLDTTARRMLSRQVRDLRMTSFWETIAANLARPWTLEEMAQVAGLSVEHLRRLCHATFHRSPMRHLTYLRMRHAAELLAVDSDKIKVVSQQVGYDNPFAFSAAFKREIGMSPSQVRTMRSKA
ncbi:MAG: DUF4965 domain-containing protein [Tepidisphaeraceae bacterium]